MVSADAVVMVPKPEMCRAEVLNSNVGVANDDLGKIGLRVKS